MEPIRIKEHCYVSLQEYNGQYRIEQGNIGADREGNPKWWADRVIPIKWDKAQGKRVPSDKEGNAKVQLGDKSAAIAALTAMLKELTGDEPQQEPEAGPLPDDDSVPF